ncbi:MAG: hypothetical protein Sapg2KO_28910 [Saprospiraceae bacterium]
MIGKIKKFFGIEGVKLELIIPEKAYSFSGTGKIEGKIRFHSMNTQEVTFIKLALVERYARGRGEELKIDDYEIGNAEIPIDLTIPENEPVEVDFELPFTIVKSDMDAMGDKNFLFKGLVNAAKYISKVKSDYKIIAEAKVKGTALNPFDKKTIIIK